MLRAAIGGNTGLARFPASPVGQPYSATMNLDMAPDACLSAACS